MLDSSRRIDLAEGRGIPTNFEEAEFVQQAFISYVQQLCTATYGSEIEFARGRVGALLRQMGPARALFRLEMTRRIRECDVVPRFIWSAEHERLGCEAKRDTPPLEPPPGVRWSCHVCGGKVRNELGACIICPCGPRDPR